MEPAVASIGTGPAWFIADGDKYCLPAQQAGVPGRHTGSHTRGVVRHQAHSGDTRRMRAARPGWRGGTVTRLSRLLHACYTPVTRPLHACYTPVTRLLHAYYTPVTRPGWRGGPRPARPPRGTPAQRKMIYLSHHFYYLSKLMFPSPSAHHAARLRRRASLVTSPYRPSAC